MNHNVISFATTFFVFFFGGGGEWVGVRQNIKRQKKEATFNRGVKT